MLIAIHPTTYRSGGFLAHGVLKLKHNEAYLSMLDASLDELSAGNIISKPQTE